MLTLYIALRVLRPDEFDDGNKFISPVPVAAQSKGVDLRRLTCWDCGFDSRRGHGCLSLVLCVFR